MYCKKCGGKLESYASNCAFCGAPVEKYDTTVNYVKPEKQEVDVKPMTALKWLGLILLPFIPFIGPIAYLVLIFKWAFSSKDITLKGFAQAILTLMLVAVILTIIYVIILII